MYLYKNREEGGKELVKALKTYDRKKNNMILALVNGGLPVVRVIAEDWGTSFDVILAREIFYPGFYDVEIGAMTENEKIYLADNINFADPRILESINEERHELRRQLSLFRRGHALPDCRGQEVLLVDDGLFDGVRALAGAKYLKERGARKITLAVPVALDTDRSLLMKYVDEIVCPHRPIDALSVGRCYEDYSEVSDEVVMEILSARRDRDFHWHQGA